MFLLSFYYYKLEQSHIITVFIIDFTTKFLNIKIISYAFHPSLASAWLSWKYTYTAYATCTTMKKSNFLQHPFINWNLVRDEAEYLEKDLVGQGPDVPGGQAGQAALLGVHLI